MALDCPRSQRRRTLIESFAGTSLGRAPCHRCDDERAIGAPENDRRTEATFASDRNRNPGGDCSEPCLGVPLRSETRVRSVAAWLERVAGHRATVRGLARADRSIQLHGSVDATAGVRTMGSAYRSVDDDWTAGRQPMAEAPPFS